MSKSSEFNNDITSECEIIDEDDDNSILSLELLPSHPDDASPPSPPIVTPSQTLNHDRLDNYKKQYGMFNQEEFEIDIPQPFHLVERSQLKRIQNKAAKYDELIRTLSRPCYQSHNQADTMLGYAASLVPQCGYSGLSTILPILVSSVFINAGIHIPAETLIAALPSPQYLQNSVTNYAAETMLLVRNSINANPNIYFSSDKGNKKGNKNLAKFFCWYDVIKKIVRTFLLDVDCVDENTEDIFKGTYHSIQRFFESTCVRNNTDIPKLRGQCTDSGGGDFICIGKTYPGQ